MNSYKIITLLASLSGLIGSIILAYSLNRVLSEIHLCIYSFSSSIETMIHSHNILQVEGLDKRLNKEIKISGNKIKIGICYLITSTILASMAIIKY